MSQSYTYSDPYLSLWQSAVAEVHRSRDAVQNRMATGTDSDVELPMLLSEDGLMSPVQLLGAPLKAGLPVPPITLSMAAPTRADKIEDAVPIDCAKIAAQFLWAEMTGNHQKSQLLAGELKHSVCDVGWGECVSTYLAYKASGGNLPYRSNMDVVVDLGQRTKLAILGDWGTGDEVAINLLQQVASFRPEVLVHLGDVYYAGTENEERSNFLEICQQILGTDVPIFSLCGNHDMYSGGNGYYWLVDQIGQKASYFCLQNPNWQFLAMDTGHNDHNPLTVASNMTSLMTVQDWSEANWHLDKIRQAGTRKTVMLSHHQLFSPFGAVGKVDGRAYAYNPNLFTNFRGVLSKIDWWFWGHEHTLAVFDPYMGLQRGRCLGASAVPVFTDQQSYTIANGLQTYQNGPPPSWNPNAVLGTNGTDYSHAFAIMTLDGASASVNYYQVPILGTASKLSVTDTA